MINPKTFLENAVPIEFQVITKSGKKATFTTTTTTSNKAYRLVTVGDYKGASVVAYSIQRLESLEQTFSSVPQKISEVIAKLLLYDKTKLMQIEKQCK